MRIVSVNTGQPAPVPSANRDVVTGIFKYPVHGRVRVRRHNLEGDKQADPRVHGGPLKAVYAYPSEHYVYWREQLPDQEMPWGMFGENLTLEGLLETQTHIGDRFRFGSAVLRVTQPRMPCFKLALRFGRSDMVKRFWASGRSGFYFAVEEEGDVGTGDSVEAVLPAEPAVSVSEIVELYQHPFPARERLVEALRTPLAGSWKKTLEQKLNDPQGRLDQ